MIKAGEESTIYFDEDGDRSLEEHTGTATLASQRPCAAAEAPTPAPQPAEAAQTSRRKGTGKGRRRQREPRTASGAITR
jgi:hypothetical protein